MKMRDIIDLVESMAKTEIITARPDRPYRIIINPSHQMLVRLLAREGDLRVLMGEDDIAVASANDIDHYSMMEDLTDAAHPLGNEAGGDLILALTGKRIVFTQGGHLLDEDEPQSWPQGLRRAVLGSIDRDRLGFGALTIRNGRISEV